MVGNAAKRLNMEISGYRSLLAKTVRAMPLDPAAGPLARTIRQVLTSLGQPTTGAMLRHHGQSVLPVLSAILAGHQARRRRPACMAGDDERGYLMILAARWRMSAAVTLLLAWCWAIRWPTGWSNLPTRTSIC